MKRRDDYQRDDNHAKRQAYERNSRPRHSESDSTPERRRESHSFERPRGVEGLSPRGYDPDRSYGLDNSFGSENGRGFGSEGSRGFGSSGRSYSERGHGLESYQQEPSSSRGFSSSGRYGSERSLPTYEDEPVETISRSGQPRVEERSIGFNRSSSAHRTQSVERFRPPPRREERNSTGSTSNINDIFRQIASTPATGPATWGDGSETNRGSNGRGFNGRGRGYDGGGSRGGDRGQRRGGGRGGRGDRGRGRGRGRVSNFVEDYREFDLVECQLKDSDGNVTSKKGVFKENVDRRVRLISNYFEVNQAPSFAVFKNRVDFVPDVEETHVKKHMFKPFERTPELCPNVFNGSELYTLKKLETPMIFYAENRFGRTTITVRHVEDCKRGDVTHLVMYNNVMRAAMENGLKLELLGRNFYDSTKEIRFDEHQLALWPGYITTIRNLENKLLLNVEMTHKVIRLDTVFDLIENIKHNCRNEDYKRIVKAQLVGSIIMTRYNKKTYPVSDIDFSQTPESTFKCKGEEISFIDFFHKMYNIKIEHYRNQPLIISKPSKRDLHAGRKKNSSLIPELCVMTGFSQNQRENFNLMKDLGVHMASSPARRTEAITNFMRQLTNSQEVNNIMADWGLGFETEPVKLVGRQIGGEAIYFSEDRQKYVKLDDKADWTKAFHAGPNSQKMFRSINLIKWVIIVTNRDRMNVDNLVNKMQSRASPMGFKISEPLELMTISDPKPISFLNAIKQAVSNYPDIQLLFIILPNQNKDLYANIKRSAYIEYGIACQCYLSKNVMSKAIDSICTKVTIQMNAKLGGEPWHNNVPLKSKMFVGFDVYHCGKRIGGSVGSLVSTRNDTGSLFYSSTTVHKNQDELANNFDIRGALLAYQETTRNNHPPAETDKRKLWGFLPENILIYRDGVGEGQLAKVKSVELDTLLDRIKMGYKEHTTKFPNILFVVVTKKINTRIMTCGSKGPDNPFPGTVVDDEITHPERFDFYLISQVAKHGTTVSPTAYNVIYNTTPLDADKIQRMTFKLCTTYYNWSGTVSVPAPCQYAKKLAHLTGMCFSNQTHHSNIKDVPFFL